MRLCALLRAIVMRLSSVESKRRRMSRVYRYIRALVLVMEDFKIKDGVLIVKLEYDTKYAVDESGRVYAVRGGRLVELNSVEEIEAIRKIEAFVAEKAKALASRIGVDADRILNPPVKTKRRLRKNENTREPRNS